MKITKIMGCVVTLTTLITMASGAVMAQEEEASKINLRLGLFRPSQGLAKEATGRTWTTVDLVYDHQRDASGRPTLQAEAGVMESGSGGNSILRLGVNKLFWRDKSRSNGLYFGGGVGLYKMRVVVNRETKACGQIFIGYDVKDAYFVELRDVFLPSIDVGSPGFTTSINMSGIELTLGTRRIF